MSDEIIIDEYESDSDLEFEKYLDEISLYDYKINTIYESLIIQAIEKRALIELCSLLYNAIELNLIRKIHENKRNKLREIHITKLKNNNLKGPILPKQEFIFRQIADKEIKDIWNKYTKTHLLGYAIIARKQTLVNKELFEKITEFNTNRNTIMHKLLIPETKMKYWDIVDIAKDGREIQLILTGNYSDLKIKKELKKIENIKPVTIDLKSLKNISGKI